MALPDMKKTGRIIRRPPDVHSIDFDSAMTRYALRFRNGSIEVRSVADDGEIAHFQARGFNPHLLKFSPDGRYLATSHVPDLGVTVWDVETGTVALNDPGPVWAANYSPDGGQFACAHPGEVIFFDLSTGNPVRRWPGPAEPRDLAFRPDGTQIAVVDTAQNNKCSIFEVQTGRLVTPIEVQGVNAVAWSPEGNTLSTTFVDARIYLWDTSTGIQRARLEGHTGGGVHAAFDPTGTLLASNGWEHQIRLWDAALGRPVLSMISKNFRNSAEFSRDGRIVVAGSRIDWRRTRSNPRWNIEPWPIPSNRRRTIQGPRFAATAACSPWPSIRESCSGI